MALEDHLGDILQKARAGRGLSLSRLARASGLEESAIRRIEDLERSPSAGELKRLGGALGLDAEKLAAIAEGSWEPERPPADLKEQVLHIRGSIGGYPVNGYILYEARDRRAAAVDTAYDAEAMLEALSAHGLSLQYVLLTHCHRDHMGGVEALKRRTGAAVLLHANELPLFRSQSRLNPDGFVNEQTPLALGKTRIQVRSTPGHTPGGVTYIADAEAARPLCFPGDALFAGSTGRSMSPAGYESLLASLADKVLSLPDETRIFPGHGPPTTVGEERRHNPFF